MRKLDEKALDAALRAFQADGGDPSGPLHEVVVRAYLDALPPVEGALVEAMARAMDALPNLFLHEVEEDEWHVCYWGDRIDGEKREWFVVREACNRSEAAEKRDEEVRRRRAQAALSLVLRIVEEEQVSTDEYPPTPRQQAEAHGMKVMKRRLLTRLRECVDVPEIPSREADLQSTFDLRWKADMRAINLWQERTGKKLTWPDHADLVVWLLDQVETLSDGLGPLIDEAAALKAASEGRGEWRHAGPPKDGTPIQFHIDGWTEPRCAKWSAGSWWINDKREHRQPDRWAPMLPLPTPPQSEGG